MPVLVLGCLLTRCVLMLLQMLARVLVLVLVCVLVLVRVLMRARARLSDMPHTGVPSVGGGKRRKCPLVTCVLLRRTHEHALEIRA